MKSTKINFIYNIIYQILIMFVPLITTPYLARVVGTKGVGTYSYTYSIIFYFMMFTMLGVNNHGNRAIAKSREDKSKLSNTFWNIYIIQFTMGITMLIIYLLYVNFTANEYKIISLIQSIYIISSMIDINWFYFGLEEFKITISRNLILKFSNIILIFLFVRSYNDLWKYTLIVSGMTFISQSILWTNLINRVNAPKIKYSEMKNNICPMFTLFIPVILVSLYKVMDKLMLGKLSNIEEVGLYENAEKIISIPLSIISALGTVMLPKMANIISKGDDTRAINYIKKSLKFIMFLSLPMFFGLAAIGKKFAPLFFGEEFRKSGILIILLSITLPFLSFANVIRTQYLIPKEKDKVFIVSSLLGAIVNFLMNIIFIKKYQSIGACIGTIAAEIIVMLYQTFKVKDDIAIDKALCDSLPFFIKSLMMFSIIVNFNKLNIIDIKIIILQVFSGIVIYLMLNIKYLFELFNFKRKF